MSRSSPPHVTVAGVIERDGEFLMVEESVGGAQVMNQPAGHLENGETLVEAAIREVYEETGYRFRPESVVGIYRWRNPDDGETFLRVAYCGTVSGAAAPSDPAILAVHWMGRAELQAQDIRPRSPLVLRAIDDYLAGQRLPLSIISEL